MSSACVVLKQPSCSAVPWPRSVNSRSDTNDSPCSQTSLWRPWLSSSRDVPERCPQRKLSHPYSRPTVPGCFLTDGKAQSFQHPVRLFWPKSKSFDYLYSDGETLLRNFPVQATISFYDESDSEDDDDDEEEEEEEEDWEEDGDSEECLKQQSHFSSYN